MASVKKTRVKWACPQCGSEPEKHGKGGASKCDYDRHGSCVGFLCECDDHDSDRDHGMTFSDPCPNANCYHCGWGGEFPVKPKGIQPWEKKALEAGWVMPEARRKELGLK